MSGRIAFDPVLHSPVRLQMCALLSAVDEAEYALIRAEVDVSESVLSKHARQLEEAGYLRIRKATLAARQRTWLSLTAQGRQAFAAHVRELTRLAGIAQAAE
ncbi:transcriptional regulator [Sphingomonas qomolangmaensis]|uniref:Transcriptional regulator n=1 Tax=Sphingomonas qomolangmaensis TaxID=2918765 RepID=A0ABY5L4M0_9SPHN|nr:transcriptional regulator [Sphingomonas qomolangmaensis]UUL81747.1 transcriptional regulator [Sphingomonas qomolangmaensis]